jgi:hypothetical protein
LTIALTSEASTWAMLMFGFGGLGFAAFSVGMKVGQIAEAAWWKGKLQEALTSTREPPPPRQMSLVRERQELGESHLRPGSLLRPPPLRLQAGPLASQRVLRGAGQGGLFRSDGRAPLGARPRAPRGSRTWWRSGNNSGRFDAAGPMRAPAEGQRGPAAYLHSISRTICYLPSDA